MINKARSLSLEIFLMTNYERDELKSGEKSGPIHTKFKKKGNLFLGMQT